MKDKNLVFSVSTKRFTALGFHPKLDKYGFYKKDKNKLAPWQYAAEYQYATPLNNKKQTWSRQLDSEEFSKNLGFMRPSLLAERDFMKKHLGPGTHEIDEFFKLKDESDYKNSSFSKQERFKQFDQNIPGPATHDVEKKQKHFNKSSSTFPKIPRFKETGYPWSLACNRYEVVDTGSLDALINKVVSTRGPYDLFTGPRGDTNIFNKFNPGEKYNLNKFYDIKTDIDNLLYGKCKKRTGKFLQAPRFPIKPTVRMMLNDISLCYKDKRAPGPAHYNVNSNSIEPVPESEFPFGLTSPEDIRRQKWSIFPGPGRYHIKYPKCRKKKPRGTCVFLSKTGRNNTKISSK